MNKKILLCGLAFAGMLNINAADKLYNTEDLGDMYNVSDNGRYAVVSDFDNKKAYLWDSSSPDLFLDITPDKGDSSVPSGQRIVGASANDVSDHGLVVGALYYADGKSYPAIYDNKWTRLEVPAKVQNSNECIAVTPDGWVIAGYSNKIYTDYDGTTQGQYFPVQWYRNSDGEYELKSYADQDFYDHQGFFPTCMSPDSSVIGGRLYCGVASEVPAIMRNGELELFDEITFKEEPFTAVINGELKYYCGIDYENKTQIWTTDPDDPRIVMYREPYIDGVHDQDMEGLFVGGFNYVDDKGNLYGNRTRVISIEDDGEKADLTKGAAIYNYIEDKWTDNVRSQYYTCGVGNDLIFANNNAVYIDGEKKDISDVYDLSTLPTSSTGIAKISLNGMVLGGVRQEFVEAIGDYLYYPYIVVCDGAYDSVRTIGVERPAVIVGNGKITVAGGEGDVYDLNGRKVASGQTMNVAPGTYVIKAGETNVKAIVR